MWVPLLALTWALVACQQTNLAPEFARGQTYVYQYEADVMGGLPEEGLARAGVKVRSKVLISADSTGNFILKLVDTEILEFSGIWPKEDFTPATKLTSTMADQLSTPIRFEYANGVVGKVFAPAGLSETVLNLQRAILNIFQLNIKQTQNVYELQEPGTQGVCKTHYVISEDSNADRILLTKSKDLNQCQERIMKDIGLAYAERCVECEARGQSMKGASAFNYVIKKEATSALILEVSGTEMVQISPFNILNGAAQMESKQSLKFQEIQKAPLDPIKGQYLQRGSLQYEFGSELLQAPVQLLKITDVEAQIVEILNHVVINNVGKVHGDAPLKFIELIQLMRMAKCDIIAALWTHNKDRADYRRWLLNAIPAVGTSTALKFLKEKFLADELTHVESSKALLATLHMMTADLEVIKITESLAAEQKIQDNPLLREIVMLGYGTLVAKYCAENPNCPAELVRPLHELAAQAISSKDDEKLVLVLKVLGNAGHPSSLKPITKLLPGFGSTAAGLPLRVHVDAVLALRNIAKREPKMIRDMVVQLFMDKALKPELRMVAAIVLFETKLPMGLVITLANALLKENNLQVASFVYSYMKAMTKNTTPELASVASACNVAMKILSPKLDRLSYRFSRTLYLDAYSDAWMAGAAASAFYINDAATVLPRTFVAKARTYLAGAYADVVEVGVRTEGIQEALLKIQETPEDTDRLTKMRQVMKALSQWRAEPSSQPLASVYVKFFGQERAFANIDKALINQLIELANGPAILTSGKPILEALVAGFQNHYVDPFLISEVRRILPTTVGLPMELSFYTAAVGVSSVEFKATVTPPLPVDYRFAQLLKSDISLKAAINPRLSVHTYAVMGVNTAFIQASLMSRSRVHAIAPAKIEARIEMIKGNFKLQLLPIEGVNNILSTVVDTFAVARNVEDLAAAKITPIIPATLEAQDSRQNFTSSVSKMASSQSHSMSASSEIITIDQSSRNFSELRLPKEFQKRICSESKTFGIRSCGDIRSRNATFLKNSPFYSLIGRHSIEIDVSPAAGPAIERIEIEVQVGEKAAQKIIKVINRSEEERIKDKSVLMKLKKILAPSPKNSTSSSSSSSNSATVSSRSSSSSSSESANTYSSSSSRHNSKQVKANNSSSSSSSRSSHMSSSNSSSSSSSRSSSRSKQQLYDMKFIKSHIHQHDIYKDRANSNSSAQSFEDIYNNAKYLSQALNPAVTILIRAVRVDQKVQGYQIAAYIDKVNHRLQIIFANLEENNHWRICVDGVLLSNHKAMAKFAWGIQCKEYDAEITVESGRVGKDPAIRLKLTWNKLPNNMKRLAKEISEYISRLTKEFGISQAMVKNIAKQIILSVAAASDTTLNVVLKTPKRTMFKVGVGIPVSLPIGDSAAELEPYQDNIADKISYMFARAHSALCVMYRDTLITFNKRKVRMNMPDSCFQMLAQDCTPELKFIVLLKRDQKKNQNQIYVRIANLEVELYPKNGAIMVKINGLGVPNRNLPYKHPTGLIHIRQIHRGISISAHRYGLQQVYLDMNILKIRVVDWMRGNTCGICGKGNGEIRQEFQTPNQRLASDAVSFAHSWVLPGMSCRDASECYLKHESVKLEKQVILHGQESKCFSAEPVLRCLPGCIPTRTTTVNVGYNCLPADSELNRSVGQSNIFDKSIDLRETADAHLACHCTAQCA
ncbi:vitellogenin-2-like [Clinocottus analis]|uniref:vitellogenin-2-like n=1 Tax=Clinocottus analis TaxID=304258 RepID=UPI0035BFEC63